MTRDLLDGDGDDAQQVLRRSVPSLLGTGLFRVGFSEVMQIVELLLGDVKDVDGWRGGRLVQFGSGCLCLRFMSY